MSVRITFEKMKSVSSEIFGLELVRAGSRFRIYKGDIAIGEGWGELWTLKNIHAMFQEWLEHPQALSLLRTGLKEALIGCNSSRV